MTTPKKTLTLTETVLTEYKTGPEAHLRKCILCHEDIEPSDRWLKMTRPGQYSIGAHTACIARRGHKLAAGDIAAARRLAPGARAEVRA